MRLVVKIDLWDCKKCGGQHNAKEPWPVECREVYDYSPPPAPKRSNLAVPYFISDTVIEGVQSMVDGKIYTSKAALRASYKAAGVVEVGNDPARLKPRQKQKTDPKKIKESLEKAAARVSRGDVSPHLKDKL